MILRILAGRFPPVLDRSITKKETRMNKCLFYTVALVCLFNACSAPEQKIKKRTMADIEVLPFHPSQILIHPGTFGDIRAREIRRLLEINPKIFLSGFQEPGSMDSTRSWQNGYRIGPYLSACSKMYATTLDPRFSDRIIYVVEALEEIQNRGKSGFLGSNTTWEAAFFRISGGEPIRATAGTLNGMERPWYYTASLMTGLMDAYLFGDNRRALQVATRMADWIHSVCKNLPQAEMDRMLFCDPGRISEALANVYVFTGRNRFRFLAFRFQHSEVDSFHKGDSIALQSKDVFAEISKVLGYAKLYELLAAEHERDYTQSLWEQLYSGYTYPGGALTGDQFFGTPGISSHSVERFAPQLAPSAMMARFTHRLFCWHPDARLGDYIEKVLYNQFLPTFFSKQQPDFSLPMQPGALPLETSDSINAFRNFEMSLLAPVDFSGAIYYEGEDGSLYINLFIPSSLSFTRKKMHITLETQFPEESRIVLRFEGEPREFPVRVRYPAWAKFGVKALIDGQPVETRGEPGSFLTFESKWGYGSSLELSFPMYLTSESLPEDSRKTSLFFGPLLLAGYPGEGSTPEDSIHPTIVAQGSPLHTNFYPLAEESLVFHPTGVISPSTLRFMPVYKDPQRFHSIYWEVNSPAE